MYDFHFPEENRIVTNNEETYLEHKDYLKNKKYHEDRLKTMPANMLPFEKNHQERLKIDIRKPTGLKIDAYLEKYKVIRYNYDYGYDWWFTITLEEIVDDYYFGYPTFLDGAETAPPEDVGGIEGFYEFWKAYKNPKHPDHKQAKEWVADINFREFDPVDLNSKLKCLDYKKTEWDKIKHENYIVNEDKYRK